MNAFPPTWMPMGHCTINPPPPLFQTDTTAAHKATLLRYNRTLENLPGQQTLHGLTKATYSTVCEGFAKQSWLHQFIISKIVFSHSHSKIYKQAVHVQMFTAKCSSMRQAKRDLKSMMGLTNAPVCVLSSLWQATSKLDRVNMLCQCNLNNHITYYHKKSCVLTEARALHSNMSFITATIS